MDKVEEKNPKNKNKRTAEALNASKSASLQTVLNSGKNILVGILHQMESTLKVTEV